MNVVVAGGDKEFADALGVVLSLRWRHLHIVRAVASRPAVLLVQDEHPDILIVAPCRTRACYELLNRVRAFSNVPVLVVSDRDDVAYRVRALESGADDWMRAEASPLEFCTRVNALLRRRTGDGGRHLDDAGATAPLWPVMRKVGLAGDRPDSTAAGPRWPSLLVPHADPVKAHLWRQPQS